jgi:hypothetical protein
MKLTGIAGFELDQVEREDMPSVFESKVVTKKFRGELLGQIWRNQNSDKSTNDNLLNNNKISLVINKFFMNNIANLKYVEYNGVKWRVESFDIKAPRIHITLGGVYNG